MFVILSELDVSLNLHDWCRSFFKVEIVHVPSQIFTVAVD